MCALRRGPVGPEDVGGPSPRAALPRAATPVLRALEAEHRAHRPAAEVDAWLHSLETERAGFIVAMLVLPPGARRAEMLHLLVARELSRLPSIRPTCARGCSACCSFEVEVTGDEADLLAERIEAGLPVDRARLALQAARRRRDPAWAVPGDPANRCVMLGDDGACRAYAYRPAACRKLLVVSPPIECARAGGAPSPITIPRAELAVAAALAMPGATFGSLSSLLTAALARRQRRRTAAAARAAAAPTG